MSTSRQPLWRLALNGLLNSEVILCGRFTHITCSACQRPPWSLLSTRLLDSVQALYGQCICPTCNTIDRHDVNMSNQDFTCGTGSHSSRSSGGDWSKSGGQSSGSYRHSFEQSAIVARSTCITSTCALGTTSLVQDLTRIVVVEDTR